MPYDDPMRRVVFAVILELALVGGCTRHKPLSELTEVAGQDDVYVETFANEKVDVIAVPTADGLEFKTSESDSLDNGQIKTVVEVQRARGAIQGIGIGALSGIAAGIAIGFASGDDKCDMAIERDCYYTLTAGGKAVIGGVVLGGLGGIGGLIVGAIYGAHDIYEYGSAPAPVPRVMPMGPPGSVTGMTVLF